MKTDFQNFIEDAKIAILSMSTPRKIAILEITSLSRTIAHHLALIAAYPEAQEQNHWRKEMAGYFRTIQSSIAGCSVRIPTSVVMQLLYEYPLGTPKDLIVVKQWAFGHMKPKKVDEESFRSFQFEPTIKQLLLNPEYLYL